MQEEPVSRSEGCLGIFAMAVIALFGLAWLAEARSDMARGVPFAQAITLSTSNPGAGVAYPVPAYNPPAPRAQVSSYSPPPAAPAPAAPAAGGGGGADPYTCVNGRNPYGLECAVEADGVHVFPPAANFVPCTRADGQVQLMHTDATGQTTMITGAKQWDPSIGVQGAWTVAVPNGRAVFFSLPACGQ